MNPLAHARYRRNCRAKAQAALRSYDFALIWGLRNACDRFLTEAVQWYDKALYDGPEYKRTVGTLAWLRFIDHDTKEAPVKADTTPEPYEAPLAMIYLRTEHDWLSAEDLERLDTMRRYALDAGWQIRNAWPVKDPRENPGQPRDWALACKQLKRGRIDVIVYWDEHQGAPLTRTRETLSPSDTMETTPPPYQPHLGSPPL